MNNIVINDQEWASKNLDVKFFRNGDKIMEAQSYDEWEHAAENKIPAWCYYNENDLNEESYGVLYNWYAVNDPRGLAPEGWKVPSIDDWEKLAEFLGDNHAYRLRSDDMWMADDQMASFFSSIRGKLQVEDNKIQLDEAEDNNKDDKENSLKDDELDKIIDYIFGSDNDEESVLNEKEKKNTDNQEDKRDYKNFIKEEDDDEIDESDFEEFDSSILNSTNFDAQPGGARGRLGNQFFALGDSAYWWTSSEYDEESAFFILLYYHNEGLQIGGSTDKKAGHSIRCIKDK
jgi:uncharacterized protein (TIGR02145 family)